VGCKPKHELPVERNPDRVVIYGLIALFLGANQLKIAQAEHQYSDNLLRMK